MGVWRSTEAWIDGDELEKQIQNLLTFHSCFPPPRKDLPGARYLCGIVSTFSPRKKSWSQRMLQYVGCHKGYSKGGRPGEGAHLSKRGRTML